MSISIVPPSILPAREPIPLGRTPPARDVRRASLPRRSRPTPPPSRRTLTSRGAAAPAVFEGLPPKSKHPGDDETAPGISTQEEAAGLPPVLTVHELAALLRVDRKTVYNLISGGDIPGVRRLGKTIRISRDAVLRWLSEGQGRVSRSRGSR
jgi:excisionase family DNA binding protein